jgi:hypothetical protein
MHPAWAQVIPWWREDTRRAMRPSTIAALVTLGGPHPLATIDPPRHGLSHDLLKAILRLRGIPNATWATWLGTDWTHWAPLLSELWAELPADTRATLLAAAHPADAHTTLAGVVDSFHYNHQPSVSAWATRVLAFHNSAGMDVAQRTQHPLPGSPTDISSWAHVVAKQLNSMVPTRRRHGRLLLHLPPDQPTRATDGVRLCRRILRTLDTTDAEVACRTLLRTWVGSLPATRLPRALATAGKAHPPLHPPIVLNTLDTHLGTAQLPRRTMSVLLSLAWGHLVTLPPGLQRAIYQQPATPHPLAPPAAHFPVWLDVLAWDPRLGPRDILAAAAQHPLSTILSPLHDAIAYRLRWDPQMAWQDEAGVFLGYPVPEVATAALTRITQRPVM